MDIPAKVTVPICIEQGSIYHYHIEKVNKDGTKYQGNRFFIVLNANPQKDEALVLVTITTRIVRQQEYIKRIGEDPDTLVSISPTDFNYLSAESVINCNNIFDNTLSNLIKDIENGGRVFFDKLPKSVIDSLISGVLKSKQVSPDHKKLIV